MSIHIDQLLLSKKVLLLQGPMGGFFQDFAAWLNSKDIKTFKLNFNGGDQFFFKANKNVFDYKDHLNGFEIWLLEFLKKHEIDAIVCFGDCRRHHRIAKNVADQLNLNFFVFEEGYIRPNYITFEQGGVNFFSNFLNQFESLEIIHNFDKEVNVEVKGVQNSYLKIVYCAILYYLFWIIYSFKYRNYQHHRGMHQVQEGAFWLVSAFRNLKNKCIEKKQFKFFLQKYSHQYYVFSLQVHNDAQIRVHSKLKDVEHYIELVIKNFALNAPLDKHLLLKHHPMDRGYRNYKKLIRKLAKIYGVEDRIHYYCDIHLPTLLKNSLGMVTVNSTTVIQALYHQVPVKVLGSALYDLPRLTNQDPLSEFWKNPGKVDVEYFTYFRRELIKYSQLNGSFYGLSPWKDTYSEQSKGCDKVSLKD